jgi:hypothetical protein
LLVNPPATKLAIRSFGSTEHFLVSLMASYVGLNPAADINWITNPTIHNPSCSPPGRLMHPSAIHQELDNRARGMSDTSSSTSHRIVHGLTISAAW